jgi:hypothetical protein
VAFMLQACVKKCTPLCVFTFNIKFFQIIITNNMWIKGQTGDGMATFLIENKVNSRINVACFYFRSLVCQILIIWGMDHVGTWFCKRCVWNLTYWVQFRSCQARCQEWHEGNSCQVVWWWLFDLDKCDNMNAMIRTMYEVLKVCLSVYFDL